jgi:3'-phosphoadenosine 5'-phosphosulfate sulfotransferase
VDMIAGAGELGWRIACQAHWRQAVAVRDGRQSASDPDADRVRELGDGFRLYQAEAVERHRDGVSLVVHEQLRKHLADGWWQAATVEVPVGGVAGD